MHMHVGGGGGHWHAGGPRRPQDARTAFRRSIRWAKPLWPILAFGLVCTLAGVFLGQQPPRIIQYLIDTVIGAHRYHLLTRVILVYLGIVFVGQIIGAASGYWMNIAGQRLLHTLRTALYDHLQMLSLSYYDNKRTGDLVSRVTGDVSQVEGMIIGTSKSLVRQLFGVGLAFYYMWGYNWPLALLVLIPVPRTRGQPLLLHTPRACGLPIHPGGNGRTERQAHGKLVGYTCNQGVQS